MEIEKLSNSPCVGCSPGCLLLSSPTLAVCMYYVSRKNRPASIDSKCPASSGTTAEAVEGRLLSLIS